ncbi:FtsH protease activity modulator HflK [Sphingomonas sp. ID1715]|uniref:FtsH protease activity modulator HflK n=1 Tax=Sphingomonas sp. ID1715 TaxID=1656898 RepID=UPI001487FB45|nr:FtsH protease activity modulator HflK [Sphingomonas sp. ID1715]
MNKLTAWLWPQGAMLNEGGGPWGNRGGGQGNGGGGDGDGPRNPWSPGPSGGRPRGNRPTPAALDELLRRGRQRLGGGGGLPDFGGRPIWLYGLGVFLLLWILLTSFHRIGPQERGVIMRFGSYAGTMSPGIGVSFPSPIDRVVKQDIEAIRTVDIGSPTAESENLMLTGDQNIVDLAYSVRWNISDPALFLFQLAEPEETIREVGESAMRAVIGTVSLNDAIGSGRTAIETQVAQRMQELLNDYRAGVRIQGVAIKQADPPQAVTESFKKVSAAQQQAISYLNGARAYAQQITARAQGEAAAFDKVYEQYKLSPDVTRRRMYYETMEEVLSKVDKTIVEPNGVTPYLPLDRVQRPRPAEEVQQ